MGVKTENVERAEGEVVDDLSKIQVELGPEKDESVNEDKLAALKAKMAAKEGKEEDMPVRILDKKERSLEFGVIGSGQAGSRLAESFYKLGYDALAFNTARQDLEHIDIPEANKCLLEYGLGGASKDPQIGKEAAETHRDYISAKINDQLGDADIFCFCTSLGGGSGGGSIDTMIEVMAALGKPVVVMTVLPMTNEDPQTKKNSLEALKKLATYVQQGMVHNLVVVDNAKIETIFKDIGPMNFYKVSNAAIVNPLDAFNTYSSMPSAGMKVMDPMEWTKILIDGNGLSLYGEISVANYEEDTALAEAVVENLAAGLLAEGFDLKQTKYVGAIFLANEKVWAKVPAAAINYAMTMVQDHAGTPQGVFRGIYQADDLEEDVVKVYSFFSGLALPDSRVEELKAEVTTHMSTLKTKEESRNLNLNLDTGSKAKTKVDEVNERIKDKKSPFSQFKQGLINKRRK
jgi:cell division GTPase FtsZ